MVVKAFLSYVSRHSFAAFVHATWPGDQLCPANARVEHFVISWLPRNLQVRIQALKPECGVNLPLHDTVSVGGASCPGAISIPLVTQLSRSAKATCLSRRTVRIHLRGVKRAQVRRVTVFVNGARRQVLRGHRSSVRVTLRRLPKTTARVRLVISLGRQRSAVIGRRVAETLVPPERRRGFNYLMRKLQLGNDAS